MAFDRSMLDTFTLRGRWKAPAWQQWIPGTLEFSPQTGIRLQLDEHPEGPLEALRGILEQASQRLDVIHGVTTQGDLVTLAKSQLAGMGFSGRSGGVAAGASRYQALWMVVGEHLESSEDAKYESVAFHFANLEEVIGFAPLSNQVEGEDADHRSATVTFRNPPALSGQIDGYDVKAGYGFKTDGDAFHRMGIEVRAWLSMTADTETHIDKFLDGPCKLLSQLLGIAVGRLPLITAVEAHSPRTAIVHGSDRISNPSSIFFAQGRSSSAIRDIHPRELPFTLAGLGARFEEVLTRWQARAAVLTSSLDFFFSLDSESRVAQEHHFLNATNAVESFHRSASPNQQRWPEGQFSERLADILSRVSAEDRKWLGEQLRYANEVRFRARVKEVFDSQPEEIRGVLDNRKTFVDKVVTTRNYLTHHDKTLDAQAVRDVAELWRITKQLRLILQSLFLKELGFSGGELSTAVQRLEDYKILARRTT